MRKLWQTKGGLDAAVEAFTVGDDPALDLRLLPYEVYGSIAHAAGLARIGVLSRARFRALRRALAGLLEDAGSFRIARAQEDIHTAVEQRLTAAVGDAGAAIHAGRSRNDQVQVDLRLYMKDALLALEDAACAAGERWAAFARAHARVPLPGYTHLQPAMPGSVGHWAASHAEALLEGARTLSRARAEADSCPLGSAAGYGVPLPLDRAFVARLLGFARAQRNTLRVQSSRPRVEGAAVAALALVARDLGTLAADLSLFTTREFGFLALAPAFTTGSSIMPQKRNPDVAELLRAKAALFPGWLAQILAVGHLPSGYHRDYQATKGPLLEAFDALAAMLAIAAALPGALSVRAQRCRAGVTRELLATHEALEAVRRGVPFRSAYRAVAARARAESGADREPVDAPLPTHLGAPGNPGYRELTRELRAARAACRREAKALRAAWRRLLKLG